MYLSKDSILAVDDRSYRDVETPEWGGTVRVRSLSGQERDAFETSIMVGRGNKRDVNLKNLRAKLCMMTLVDVDGGALFAEADVLALGKKNAAALDRVFGVARDLSGLNTQDLDDLTKNSETGLNDDSISG